MAPSELADGTTCVMLLNPTGGLVGGDVLRTSILQESDTHLCLTTPSAARVYRTTGAPAVQETRIHLGERASLEYLPDHVIPHRDSRLRQTLRVEMGSGSRAIVYDALAAGRVAHGERWKFRDFDSRIEVLLGGRPVFLNRTRIDTATQNPEHLALAEDLNYWATFLVVSEESEVCAALSASMNEAIRAMPDVYGGTSVLATAGCVAKLLARSASALLQAQMELWSLARRIVFRLPAVDLRKY
jgi:urease accessory protein